MKKYNLTKYKDSPLVEIEDVVEPTEEEIIPEPPPRMESSGPDYVDKDMVLLPISVFAVNDTNRKWDAGRCYPRAYWVKGGKRMANAPQTTDQRISYDVPPGDFISFLVLVPRLPMKEWPDLLRVVILENGMGEHRVWDCGFK